MAEFIFKSDSIAKVLPSKFCTVPKRKVKDSNLIFFIPLVKTQEHVNKRKPKKNIPLSKEI